MAIDSYDMVMLGLLATAGVLGYFKGIVWQIAWIAGICLSSYVSLRFSGELSSLTGQPPPWNRLLAMLALYVGTSLVVWVTFRFVSSLIDAVHLSAFDHQLGLVFGLAKGALICVVVTFFAVTMMPAYRSEITGSQSGQIVAKLIGEADQFLPADIHETVDPFLQQFQQQFDAGDVSSSQGVVAAQSGQNDGASWQSVLEGVTSVAAWAGVEAGDESVGRGESSSPVKAAAAWMTPESSTGNAVDAADRYLNQNSAFSGSTVPSPASVLPPQNQWQGNVPQRFPVGSQTPLPVRP